MMELVFLSGAAFGYAVHKPGTAFSTVFLLISVLCAVAYGLLGGV